MGELPRLDPKNWEVLVVLGGPESITEINNYDYLLKEVDYIRAALEHDVPIYGICLGGQMLAYAQGHPVQRSPVRELGMTDLAVHDPDHYLLQGLPNPLPMLQWHEDAFTANHHPILSTSGCKFQLVDWGKHRVSTQFHPELEEKDFLDWLKDMEKETPHERQFIGKTSPQYFSTYRKLGDQFMINYIKAVKADR